MSSAQQTAVKDMNALVVLDAHVTADGKRISDFKGGTATFSVPIELKDGQIPAGVAAFFVDDNGDMTEIPCSYDGKNATDTVTHFSNNVVAYDESRVTKGANKTLTLKWTKQKNADGYLIYGNKRGRGNKMQLLQTIKKNKTVSFTQKKLKKGTYYKYMIVAYKNVNGQQMPIAASVVRHAPTEGGNTTVAKSVKLSKTKVTVKKGKSVTVKATEALEEAKLKHKTHRAVKFLRAATRRLPQ